MNDLEIPFLQSSNFTYELKFIYIVTFLSRSNILPNLQLCTGCGKWSKCNSRSRCTRFTGALPCWSVKCKWELVETLKQQTWRIIWLYAIYMLLSGCFYCCFCCVEQFCIYVFMWPTNAKDPIGRIS